MFRSNGISWHTIGLMICLYLSKPAQSQTLFFNQLDQTDGLSELTTSYLSQDTRKFIWIGTRDGLNRFDGKNIKLYMPKLPNGQTDPNLSSETFEAPSGDIWFTTANAIHCIDYQTDTLRSFQLPIEKPNQQTFTYHAFHLDQTGLLWVVANENLYHFDTHTGKSQVKHTLNSYWCYAVENAEGKVVHIANPLLEERVGIEIISYNNDGTISRNRYFTKDGPHQLPAAKMLFLYPENDSTIWLPTDKGLFIFNPYKPENKKVFQAEGMPSFCDAAAWGEQYIWLASRDKGVFQFDKKNEQFFKQDSIGWRNGQAITFTEVNNLLVDVDQNIWLSIWGRGILYTHPHKQKFSNLTSSHFNANIHKPSILFITEDTAGQIWCNIEEKGTYVLQQDGRLLDNSNPLQKFSKEEPDYILVDSSGNIWILSISTLIYRKNKTEQFEVVANGLKDLSRILEYSTNRFLLMTYSGVYELTKGEENIELNQKTPVINFKDGYLFFIDNQKRIFISDGRDKLYVYSNQEDGFRLLKILDYVGYVNSMVENFDANTIWMTTSKGLLKLNASSLEYQFVKGKSGELQRSLNCIVQDSEKKLWLSSNNGIFRYQPQSEELHYYTESDGLHSGQFQLGSCCKGKNGQLYFGSVNGLISFNPLLMEENINVPLIHLTDLKINYNEVLEYENTLSFKEKSFTFNQRTLSFSFAGIEYNAPRENQYRYFLAGFDQDTINAGTSHQASYPKLPAGSYTLNVWSANSDNIWSKEALQLKINIQPPWYQTWWFRALSLAILASILYSAYLLRIRQIQKREAYRRKEAEYKQLVAETETAVLRLQMNPHFIFNSMNSISSYILQKDITTANDYLVRFSKLMRLILDYSEKPFISLSQEIQINEKYIDAEAMRFKNAIHYVIEIDENIDTDEILIPPMILQPFVENAIIHGLANKKGQGTIKLSFRLNDDSMLCTIEDNGVGRTASRKARTSEHESKAIKITEKRLKLLSTKKEKTALQIIDLYDTSNNPAGTKVQLQFPLL